MKWYDSHGTVRYGGSRTYKLVPTFNTFRSGSGPHASCLTCWCGQNNYFAGYLFIFTRVGTSSFTCLYLVSAQYVFVFHTSLLCHVTVMYSFLDIISSFTPSNILVKTKIYKITHRNSFAYLVTRFLIGQCVFLMSWITLASVIQNYQCRKF